MKTAKTQSLIHPKAEQILRQVILKDLTNKGRKDYDRPHTEAVVFWMKYLLNALPFSAQLDSSVLITAAYAHDWGYSRIQTLSESRNFQKMISFKQLHMQFSAEMIERLLYSKLAKYYTEKQKMRVVHLVAKHDKVRELVAEDEVVLMEADTLGMLDRGQVPNTLSAEDTKRFLATSIYNLRLPRFRHSEAKVVAQQLLDDHF